MDFNRLTQKSQEAFAEAQNKAVNHGHVEVDGEHLLWALLDQPDGLVPRLLMRMDVRPEALKKEVEAELNKRPSVSGPGAEPGKIYVSQRLSRILVAAEQEAKRLKDEYVSVEHLLMALLAEGDKTASGQDTQTGRDRPGAIPEDPDRGARQPAGDISQSRSDLRSAGKIRPRPGQDGPQRQTGPGHRPRRRDPPGDPGPVPQDQEQPGADRRAGCRQDRHRGGAGPAHRAWRRAGGAEGEDRLCPGYGRRWWPAPSIAASSRSGSRRC